MEQSGGEEEQQIPDHSHHESESRDSEPSKSTSSSSDDEYAMEPVHVEGFRHRRPGSHGDLNQATPSLRSTEIPGGEGHEEEKFDENAACIVVGDKESATGLAEMKGDSFCEDFRNNCREVIAKREELQLCQNARHLLLQQKCRLEGEVHVKDQEIITLRANVASLNEKLQESQENWRNVKGAAEKDRHRDRQKIGLLEVTITSHELCIQQLQQEKKVASQSLKELDRDIQDLETELHETSVRLAKERKFSLQIHKIYENDRQAMAVMLLVIFGLFGLLLFLIVIVSVANVYR